MTYAKRLTQRAKSLIGPILPAILSLKPGDSKVFQSKSPEHLAQARSALYGWFEREGLKGRYKTMKIDLDKLMIVCIEETPLVEIAISGMGYTAIETFVQDNLFHAEDEDTARDIILKALEAGEVSNEAVVPLMDEFRKKILGQDEAKAELPEFPESFLDQLENPGQTEPNAHVSKDNVFDTIEDESVKRNHAANGKED